jgi:hypothetical protein
MTFAVTSIEQIQRTAEAAAQDGTCADTANPYQQNPDAAQIFNTAFTQARAAIEDARWAVETGQ